MIGLSYETVRQAKTNHPAGYMKADEWLHDKDSTTKTHILITDGAPHTASSACRSPWDSFEDGVPFTDMDDLPCLEACAVNNECDATICAANGEPFDRDRDCNEKSGERSRGDDCVCAIHVAGRFNAKAYYSTTIVGVPIYQNKNRGKRYTEIFNALGTSEQHYLDAVGCVDEPTCLDGYVEQTLLATCQTPYHKCMRVPDGSLGTPWSRCQQDSCIATTPNCNLMGGQLRSEANNRNYCGEKCRCDSEIHFQKKAWYHGCLTAEGSDDHAACVAACNAPWGCCGNHGDDYEYQCQSNSCGGGGCCMASAGICHRACDYSYSAWLEDPTIPVFPTPGHE